MVEGKGGPKEGNIITSVSIRDPGQLPVAFELAYPMSAVTAGASYYLYAGIQDGDLAWVTPVGVAVKAPWPLTEDVELLLAYRPDLLKGAVSGTITGVGLDPARDPEAYGTALIVKVSTGETVGFQLIIPVGAVPVPFSVPYDPTAIDPNADYVARGSVWDGIHPLDDGRRRPGGHQGQRPVQRHPHGHGGPDPVRRPDSRSDSRPQSGRRAAARGDDGPGRPPDPADPGARRPSVAWWPSSRTGSPAADATIAKACRAPITTRQACGSSRSARRRGPSSPCAGRPGPWTPPVRMPVGCQPRPSQQRRQPRRSAAA